MNKIILSLLVSFATIATSYARGGWTGYVLTVGLGQATGVEAVITMPQLGQTSTARTCDVWVGIGGFPINGKQYLSLQQTGFQVDEQFNGGLFEQYYFPWTELYPKNAEFFNTDTDYAGGFALVGSRVKVRVEVTDVKRGNFVFTLTNLDTGAVLSRSGRTRSADRGTVEWIIEDNTQFPFPVFQGITFSECKYAVNGVWYNLTSAQWVNQVGLPFAPIANSSFVITQ
jgi:hypothetical protein